MKNPGYGGKGMVIFTHKITNKDGLHAMNAMRFVRICTEYDCQIHVACREKTADAKQVLKLMGLAAGFGDELTICVEGDGEAQAGEHLKALVREIL